MSETVNPQIAAAVQAEIDRRTAAERVSKTIEEGRHEFPDFDDRSQAVVDMAGAATPAVVRALSNLPNAHRVVAHLADDLEEVERIARLPPMAMAAALGSISAKVAPRAPAGPRSPSSPRAPDITDRDMPMAEYVKHREAQWRAHKEKRRFR